MKKVILHLLVIVLLVISITSTAVAEQSDLTQPQTMSISETNLTIVKKAPKYKLTVEVFPNTAKQEVTWKSSDEKVCTVDSQGRITAKKVGSANITATSKYNAAVYKSCYVSVVEPSEPITEFKTTKEEYTCVIGKKVKLKYEIEPSNASNKYISFKVEDDDIVSVDSSGYAYGIKEGDTTVTARTDDGGFELTFYIEVSEANDAKYENFDEDYPSLHVLSSNTVNEGIWLDIEEAGMLFYDNYKGEFKKGWQSIEGEQYFFEDKTVSVIDKNYEESVYEDSDDREHVEQRVTYTLPFMKTGWYKNLNTWSYLKSDGKLANNEWVRDSNKWYLIDTDGNMVLNGEKWIGTKRYVFAESGEAITGFRNVEGSVKHYNQEDCAMDSNRWFKELDGRWYFADENGNIVKNQYLRSPDNTCDYYVDINGVMLFNGQAPDGRYADSDGKIGYVEKAPDTDTNSSKPKENIGPGMTKPATSPTN